MLNSLIILYITHFFPQNKYNYSIFIILMPNLLTKYAPRGIRNQGRPLKRLLEECDRNRPAMANFPESEMMIIMMMMMIMMMNTYLLWPSTAALPNGH
jgi:hypothetical protein